MYGSSRVRDTTIVVHANPCNPSLAREAAVIRRLPGHQRGSISYGTLGLDTCRPHLAHSLGPHYIFNFISFFHASLD
jgi:hypothetical protein